MFIQPIGNYYLGLFQDVEDGVELVAKCSLDQSEELHAIMDLVLNQNVELEEALELLAS